MKIFRWIPFAIEILAWIGLVIGVVGIIGNIGSGDLITGFFILVGSLFLFGFAVIVRAAYKYLDEQ